MQCEFVNVTTADGLDLQGLVFAPDVSPSTRSSSTSLTADARSGHIPNTVGVWIHGLTASFHSNPTRIRVLSEVFNSAGIAYATFDNRGHDLVTFARKNDKRKPKGYRSITAGASYEKFTDCVFDLDAIVDCLAERFKNVILIGHSTGANKVVYYLSRPGNDKKVSGVVLASPVSDVALYKKDLGRNYEKALATGRDMVKNGRGEELMSQNLVKDIRTVRRFLSLADQNSLEQMFPTREFRGPLTLFSKIKIPTLVIFGEKDDYLVGDGVSAKEIIDIFTRYHKSKVFRTLIIPDSDHGYRDHDADLARALVRFLQRRANQKT
ncbi:alpha/beta fold hydrolase [Candidatus Microgenomates bacterium]|nr:alpha/beta fold hydrolase [Candidatus Microgenomates bacterium]